MGDIADKMAMAFIRWKLPRGFHPDNGIKFTPPASGRWPTGTNLFSAQQAIEMAEHMLSALLTDEEIGIDEYSEGISDDGPILLKNGSPILFDDVLAELNRLSMLVSDYSRRLKNIQKWST